ncbi:MAG: hypothetical protein M0Z95_10780 [Actinomycetota bacterium]|nr:hypothetical protein [Actinomycetota bacterium]
MGNVRPASMKPAAVNMALVPVKRADPLVRFAVNFSNPKLKR